MKPITSFALLCAFAAVAQGAVTDPVGYITNTIYGTESSGVSPTLTIVSATLVQPSVFAGATSNDPSGLDVIEFSGGVPADLDNTYVLEIPSTGWWSTVISSTATTITLNDEMPTGLASGTVVSVRKHNTVQSLFGENTPGIAPFDGEAGDEIQFLTPSGEIVPVVYVPAAITGGEEDDWFFLSDSSLANDAIIEPGAAVAIKTSSAVDLTFVSTGAVKTSPTQVDVFPGLTLVGQVDAVGATLGDMNLASQMITFNGENSNYDEFQFLKPDQSLDGNIALDVSIGGPGMGNLATSEAADTTVLSEGAGAIFKRDLSEAASSITFPGATVSE